MINEAMISKMSVLEIESHLDELFETPRPLVARLFEIAKSSSEECEGFRDEIAARDLQDEYFECEDCCSKDSSIEDLGETIEKLESEIEKLKE